MLFLLFLVALDPRVSSDLIPADLPKLIGGKMYWVGGAVRQRKKISLEMHNFMVI
jgi:hypothetical protein